MRRVAVFGNAGGGKSTLAKRLAEITGLPLISIDAIQHTAAGPLPPDEYRRAHAAVLRSDAWIIEGFGDMPTAWERFAAADTRVHVDLPLARHG